MKKILIVSAAMLAWHAAATNVSDALLTLSLMPQLLVFLGFVAIGLGILSSGYALSTSLQAYVGCDKGRRALAFIPAILPGSQGLYSFFISLLMLENVAAMPLQVALAGIMCGLPCMLSALGQAKTAAACIKAINHGEMGGWQACFLTLLIELYALLGLAAALRVMV